MASRTLASSHAVFATARFARPAVPGESSRMPASEVHAKVMGTSMTLCGLSAFSWFKFWDLPFADARLDRCPACMDAYVDQAVKKRRP